MLNITEYFKGQLYVVGGVTCLDEEGKVKGQNNSVWDIENAYAAADLVASIGRSALISMSMGIPTLVYDHFGYVGFIRNEEQFKEAQKTNFSGRKFVKGLQKAYQNGDFPILKPYKIKKTRTPIKASHILVMLDTVMLSTAASVRFLLNKERQDLNSGQLVKADNTKKPITPLGACECSAVKLTTGSSRYPAEIKTTRAGRNQIRGSALLSSSSSCASSGRR